jgi:hypothetical protein
MSWPISNWGSPRETTSTDAFTERHHEIDLLYPLPGLGFVLVPHTKGEQFMDPITPRTVETKLEIATKYAEYLRSLLANDAQNEDLFCLLSVAENYCDDLTRVINKSKLTELDYYRLRNSQLLAATLI